MIAALFVLLSMTTFAQDAYFEKLASPFMEIIGPDSPYASPKVFKESLIFDLLHWKGFKVDPTGQQKAISPECSPLKWQSRVLAASKDFKSWSPLFANYWKDCEDQLQTGRNGLFSNTIEMINYYLDLRNHPAAHQVVFHLPNGIALKGLLAMKADGKKRPLIIFRTGIFSYVGNFMSERPPFMQIFEQSPFNVLVLESLTGAEFLKNNKTLAVGGFDEGLQNFWIAREIQKSTEPLSKSISSVHFMGASMGAHGILFATLLNSLNGNKTIRSTLTICPLLNMRSTFETHMKGPIFSWVANHWTASRIPLLRDHVKNITDSDFIPQAFAWLEENYKGPLIKDPKQPLGIKIPKSDPDFWSRNDFANELKDIQTPTLILATQRDPIVLWDLNSGLIDSGALKFGNAPVQFLKAHQGFHCSLGVAYDWSAMTTLMQTFFLKNSPEFILEERSYQVPGDFSGRGDFKVQFTLKNEDEAAGVKFKFADASKVSAKISLRQFEYPNLVPVTEFNRSLWIRWLNQNVVASNEQGSLWLHWRVTK
jgi:hypothetical protein